MIKVLPKQVADKIAAGEVIERPVSIVKELVENAVDSGAGSITVEIKHGGKSYIRVTDDGCGIAKDQVETAFLRHATSKITQAKDLDSIETLGFRGEALASIAAVTHTEMVTKTADAKTGTRLLIHGSEVISNGPTGCPDGTTIIVCDLFYNTPARRKFLKSDGAESGQIIELMSQIALAYPEIRFRLINNGNMVFTTSGKGNLHQAILSVYQIKEYEDLVPVDYDDGTLSVRGYISRPSLSRTNRRSQVFFVNGRVVNSRVIEKGVTEGYKERLFDGRYPVAFLFIKTDPARLDVNIHPNKREVRFDEENTVTEAVAAAIRQALGTKAAVVEVKNLFKTGESLSGGQKKAETSQVDIKQILSTKRETDRAAAVREEEKPLYTPEMTAPKKITEEQEETVPAADAVPETKTTETSVRSVSAPGKPLLNIEAPALKPFDFDGLTVTGSIFGTYITATDEKNFYLIDQHAAHERVFYEKLVGAYLAEEKLRQLILTPIIIDVPLSVRENQYDWLDSLMDMGFAIENFGQNSYIIREIPTFMEISEAEEFVHTYIDSVSDGTMLLNRVVIDKLITKSCKSAVKAHDYLSMEEIKALLQQLKQCKNPFSCPHGRPTFIRMSQYEIERMFKRA